MAKIQVIIKQTQTATFDTGDLPVNLVRDLLIKNDGTFDGNWSIGDVPGGNETWAVESVEIVEVSGK